ncbi:MAG: hypothetical protein ABJC74_01395 [Gemmatimonadota bacterium]
MPELRPLWMWRALLAAAVVIATLAIAATLPDVVGAGWGIVRENGLMAFEYCWPTLVAFSIMFAAAIWRPELSTARQVRLAVLMWLGSAAAYILPTTGAHGWQDVGVASIFSGTGVVVFGLLIHFLSLGSLRRPVRICIGLSALVVITWFTAPLAVVLGCGLQGACP